MTLLTATDGGLMMGLFLGIVSCIGVIWVTLSAIKIAIKPQENQSRRNHIIGSIFGVVIFCNSSGNTKDIKYPNGIYKVRVSKAMPSIGRIDYEQEVIR
ncbi:MAG: hypothetical protein IPO01_18150 [Chitinophagaceae bacterium]|nr:hypothetical protein [Chitinophagaceae bacterium]